MATPWQPPGRPRRWATAAEKQRQYRQRQAQQAALLADLLHAVRNAHFDEPELAAVVREGEDADVLRALTGYYQARHWQRRRGDPGTG